MFKVTPTVGMFFEVVLQNENHIPNFPKRSEKTLFFYLRFRIGTRPNRPGLSKRFKLMLNESEYLGKTIKIVMQALLYPPKH